MRKMENHNNNLNSLTNKLKPEHNSLATENKSRVERFSQDLLPAFREKEVRLKSWKDHHSKAGWKTLSIVTFLIIIIASFMGWEFYLIFAEKLVGDHNSGFAVTIMAIFLILFMVIGTTGTGHYFGKLTSSHKNWVLDGASVEEILAFNKTRKKNFRLGMFFLVLVFVLGYFMIDVRATAIASIEVMNEGSLEDNISIDDVYSIPQLQDPSLEAQEIRSYELLTEAMKTPMYLFFIFGLLLEIVFGLYFWKACYFFISTPVWWLQKRIIRDRFAEITTWDTTIANFYYQENGNWFDPRKESNLPIDSLQCLFRSSKESDGTMEGYLNNGLIVHRAFRTKMNEPKTSGNGKAEETQLNT